MADKNCFRQEFMTTPNSWSFPSKAQVWESIEDCQEAYEEFLLECDSDDQTPAPHWLYLGIPDGNEEDYDYRKTIQTIMLNQKKRIQQKQW